MLISDEQAIKSGLTRNNTHRNPELGGGYPVFLEGMHQLHCLVSVPTIHNLKFISDALKNLVRQSLWYNVDYYRTQGQGAFSDPAKVLKWHVCKSSSASQQLLELY